jgi:CrcB protein
VPAIHGFRKRASNSCGFKLNARATCGNCLSSTWNKPVALQVAGADRRELAAIFAGGAIGSVLRTGAVELAPAHPGQWPWVTFAANILGCFLLGYLVTRLQERLPVTSYRRPLLGTGLCGALTTFSTFQLELLRLLDRGDALLAFGYGAASLTAGFVGLGFGTALVRRAKLTW